jgi:hypothetical protein
LARTLESRQRNPGRISLVAAFADGGRADVEQAIFREHVPLDLLGDGEDTQARRPTGMVEKGRFC